MSGREICGYLLAEQPFCAQCIRDLFTPFDLAFNQDHSTEDVLDVVADRRGFDRSNENSFSSYQFPKPIYCADRLNHEICLYCGRLL